jgi:hypothetical protein
LYWEAFTLLIVRQHAEINLRIDAGIQIVVCDDLLGLGVHHLFRRIHLKHPHYHGKNPMEPWLCEAAIFAEHFDESPVGWTDNPNTGKEEHYDNCNDDNKSSHISASLIENVDI